MNALELKIPPLLVWLVSAGLAWLLAQIDPLLHPSAYARAAAVLLAGGGGIIAIAGVLAFRRARTTINPTTPHQSTRIVRSGIYAHTRNPMYLGMAAALAACSLWLGSPLSLLAVAGFAAFITRFQILPEERALARLFGAEFANYKNTVRRWF